MIRTQTWLSGVTVRLVTGKLGPAALIAVLLAAVVAACGGPRMLHKPVTKRTYVAEATCTQDLTRTSFVATGGRYGESVTVTACGVHALAGTIDASAETREYGRQDISGSFGRDSDNRRCLAGDVTIAQAGRESSTARAADPGAGARTATRASTPTGGPAASAVRAFREVDWPGSVCPNTTTTTIQLGKLRKGSDIAVHVWSRQPSDITGAMVRITHNEDRPNVSDEEWARHVAEREARWEAERKRAERERKPRTRRERQRSVRKPVKVVRVEPPPTAPPPPARAESRPPQPSVNAEWLPGYWHWKSPEWLWIAGRWRVPEADVTGGLTVAAPHEPPAPRFEIRPPQPTVGAVWAAGFWQWNGTAFIWVPGSWRIAPAAGAIWQVPRWRPHRRGVVFVPGRWIRRRR